MTKLVDTLKTVKAAVARRDLVPLHSCYHFYGERVQGQNGALCLDMPCDLFDREITVNAEKFYRAVRLTKGEFNHSFPSPGKLIVSKRKFRATIPLLEEAYPRIQPLFAEGVNSGRLLELLRRLRPFVSEDASRPWSRSILFRGGYAYATNNVVMAQLPGPPIQDTRVPVLAVDILLELDMEPQSVQVTDNAIQFNFANGVWLQARLSTDKWPDVESIIVESQMEDLPQYFAESIEHIIPFCEDPKYPLIQLGDFGIATSEGLSEATIDLAEFPESLFRAEPLLIVARAAHSIALSSYPKPCYFEGDDNLRGMIIGLRPRTR